MSKTRNRCCFILPVIFLSSCTHEAKVPAGKLFEGKIHYQHSLQSCSHNYPKDFLLVMFGTSSDYYYKNGNYKWGSVGGAFSEEYYLADENRNYFVVAKDVSYGEGTDQDEDIVGFSMSKKREKILGYDCDMLSLTTHRRKDNAILNRYFLYSPEIKIDTAAFSKLKFLSHDFVSSKIHSLPLKIVMHNPDFEVTWQATSVEFMAIDDSIFNVRGKENAWRVNRLTF